MKRLIFGAIAGALLCTPALAQQQGRGLNNGGNNGNAFGANGGATFQLPPSIQNVVSIDALNMIIIASDGEFEDQTRYTPRVIQHVYSGGIARLFGGTTVPTAQFATPGNVNDNGFGNNGNQNGGNVAGIGNQNGGFGGNQNGGFGGGFGGQNGGFGGGFGGQNSGGFQSNGGGFGGFQSGLLGGNGFNTLNRSDFISARVRAR